MHSELSPHSVGHSILANIDAGVVVVWNSIVLIAKLAILGHGEYENTRLTLNPITGKAFFALATAIILANRFFMTYRGVDFTGNSNGAIKSVAGIA